MPWAAIKPMLMNFYFNGTHIQLAGGVPDLGAPSFVAFAGGGFLVIAGICGLIFARRQTSRGKEAGLQSRKQAVIAICLGCFGVGYALVHRLQDFSN
jgi:hypothetical protein